MTDNPSVLQLHHPADNRFALRFISDDKQARSTKASQLSEGADIERAIIDEAVGGEMIHLLYTRPLLDAAYPEFETQVDVIEWFDAKFSGGDKQILFDVIKNFDAILTEKEKQDGEFSTYKKMDLEKIPDILNRVEWRQLVPDVGAELLSYFILAHRYRTRIIGLELGCLTGILPPTMRASQCRTPAKKACGTSGARVHLRLKTHPHTSESASVTEVGATVRV